MQKALYSLVIFLTIYAKESDKDVEYYEMCQSTTLERHIGNCYL